MSIVKSLSVGEGDMFYIKHGSDNFTIIDCCLSEGNSDEVIEELRAESKHKGVTRFISTHPDEDHIRGLSALDDAMRILNFYCVENEATKSEETEDFTRYCDLRDDTKKAFYLFEGCSRRWMNRASDERGNAGLNVLWPITNNSDYRQALEDASAGKSPNNISIVLKYSLEDGATFLWMGDLETAFMEKIEDDIDLAAVDVLFAPHHGRKSGRVPGSWLDDLEPKLIIVGEAPSKDLEYYQDFNTITQNSAGNITFECLSGKIHLYVSNENYSVDFLDDEDLSDRFGKYIGTLAL